MRPLRSVSGMACAAVATGLLLAPSAVAEEPLLSNLSVVSATVDPKTGWAFVEVSVDCADAINDVEFFATVRQKKTVGNYDDFGDCVDGTATTTIVFTDDALLQGKRFGPGPATIDVSASGICDEPPFFCTEEDLRLTGVKSRLTPGR